MSNWIPRDGGVQNGPQASQKIDTGLCGRTRLTAPSLKGTPRKIDRRGKLCHRARLAVWPHRSL
jgi:hypothetical protein